MNPLQGGTPEPDSGPMRYAYVILLGVSSGMVFLKIWLLSFLMGQEQFAEFNYYLVIAGVLALLAPLGLLLTCHTRLPQLLADSDAEGVANLVGTAKTTIVLVGVLAVLAGTAITGGSVGLLLGGLQGSLFALFVIDQIVIKSRLAMLGYASNLLARNLLIAGAGVLAFLWFERATTAMAGETFATFVWCFFGGALRWRIPPAADLLRSLRGSAPFAAVTALGTVLTMGDRALASQALPETEFALFSYYYLAVMAALAFQQAVNTRFIAVVALRSDPGQNARDATRHAVVMFVLCGTLAAFVMLVLTLNSAYSTRVDSMFLAAVGLLAALRGADFFQAVLLARNERSKVLGAQGAYLAVLLATWFVAGTFITLVLGMICAAAGYLVLVATMTWLRGPVPGQRKVGRDDRI